MKDDDDYMAEFWFKLAFGVLTICAVIILCVLLEGCSRVEYVPVSRVQYVTRADVRHDTVAVKDSVVIYVKGDTLIRDRWRTEYKERQVVRVDTFVKADTVVVQMPAPEPQKARLRWWQRGLIAIGSIGLSSLVLFVVCIIRSDRSKP